MVMRRRFASTKSGRSKFCGVDIDGSSRLCANDSPRSGTMLAHCLCPLRTLTLCDLPMYTKATTDLLRMFASASITQTLRGTKCGNGDCMQSSK